MWQAIRTRTDELVAVWDSGRADAVDREKMSQLVWGRLDSGLGAALVSLVEAVTLCDAMISQVRARLSFDPDTADQAARLRGLRAGLVRCEDLAGVDADGARARRDPARRGSRSWSRRRPAAPTSPARWPSSRRDAARAERDLIVQVSQRRTLEKGRADARATMAALELREPTLHELADRCRREIAHPPRLAVPDVSRLGEVPGHAHRARRVRRPARGRRPGVRRRRRRLQRPPARAGRAALPARGRTRRGRRERPQRLPDRPLRATTRRAPSSTATPCDVTLARFLVEQYQYLTRDLPTVGQEGSTMIATAPNRAAPAPTRTATATSAARRRPRQRLGGTRVRDVAARHGGRRRRAPTAPRRPPTPTPSARPAPAAPARAGWRRRRSGRPARRRPAARGRPGASARPRPGCAVRGWAPA